MSESIETTKTEETSLTRDAINLGRYTLWKAVNRARPFMGGRRGMIFLAIAVLAAGAALNWSWLVAIGVAPLLLAVAPCAAMCALGLCMMGGGKSCASEDRSAGENPGTAASAKPGNDP